MLDIAMPRLGLDAERRRHAPLNKSVVNILGKIVVWTEAISLVMELAQAIGKPIPHSGLDNLVPVGVVTTGHSRSLNR